MSGTYSTVSHCKAMPLQIGIEEGSRLTAVCVGGLQYCQYSQIKISLITLLWDLVYIINCHYCSSALSLLSLFLLVRCSASSFHLAVFANCACYSFCCSLRRRFLQPICYPGSALSFSSYCQPPLPTLYLPSVGPLPLLCYHFLCLPLV